MSYPAVVVVLDRPPNPTRAWVDGPAASTMARVLFSLRPPSLITIQFIPSQNARLDTCWVALLSNGKMFPVDVPMKEQFTWKHKKHTRTLILRSQFWKGFLCHHGHSLHFSLVEGLVLSHRRQWPLLWHTMARSTLVAYTCIYLHP